MNHTYRMEKMENIDLQYYRIVNKDFCIVCVNRSLYKLCNIFVYYYTVYDMITLSIDQFKASFLKCFLFSFL